MVKDSEGLRSPKVLRTAARWAGNLIIPPRRLRMAVKEDSAANQPTGLHRGQGGHFPKIFRTSSFLGEEGPAVCCQAHYVGVGQEDQAQVL